MGDVALTEVELNSLNWYLNAIGKAEAERDGSLAAQSWEKLQKPLAVLEQKLSRQAYLAGDNFSVAALDEISGLTWRHHAARRTLDADQVRVTLRR